jgi:hypothetical protein
VSHTPYINPVPNPTIRKVWRRLIPLIFSLYLIAFIDRVNVGFAKDAMLVDTALSQFAFALGRVFSSRLNPFSVSQLILRQVF